MNALKPGETRRYEVHQEGSRGGRYTELQDAVLRAELLWKREQRKVVIEQDGYPIVVYAVLFAAERALAVHA
jgi:hypothetical protein